MPRPLRTLDFTLNSASKPICPSCGSPVRRVFILADTMAYCENRTPDGHKCGQHLHITEAGGSSLAVAISKEEFDAIAKAKQNGMPTPAGRIHEELGLYGTYRRDPDER